MFKGNRKYVILLVVFFTILIVVQYNRPRPIDWRQSYSMDDKVPYGTYALHEMIGELFPGKKVTTSTMPVYNVLSDSANGNGNYIFIAGDFSPDKLDTRSLLQFVASGNNVFVAANYIYGSFADTLNLGTQAYYYYDDPNAADTATLNEVVNYEDTVRVNFTSPYLRSKSDYIYPKAVENFIFSSFDTARTTILGTNGKAQANFIRVKVGKGSFYLSTLPQAFSNYHFVDKRNSEYVYKSLSFLPAENVLWDEYYKPFRYVEQSPMKVVLNSPALSMAYFLTLASLVLFVIFGARRRQRIIPVVEPLRNTTLDFVGIVGTLYYQKADHKNIATKKISYFLEYIRSAFFVKTNLFDEAFITKVVNLSGIPEKDVRELFNFITVISGSSIIREEEILKLNSLIEKFHRESKR